MADPRPDDEPPRRAPFEDYIVRKNQRRAFLGDAYAFFLRARWRTVFLLFFTAFLLLNLLFAALYAIVPGAIANTDGRFADLFFFSVETFGAIGYGWMYAEGAWAHAVMTVESFVSIVFFAFLTGLVFAKFSTPYARVLFSRWLLVETRDGKPTLTFRMANERTNHVVEASVRVSVLMTHHSAEGKKLRRFRDLTLVRASSPIFLLSWQVFHVIDETSPLFGMTLEDLVEDDARFIVAMTGLDGTFMQTIHARHLYWAEDVRFGRRFVDVLEDLPDGYVRIDYAKFHRTCPEGPP